MINEKRGLLPADKTGIDRPFGVVALQVRVTFKICSVVSPGTLGEIQNALIKKRRSLHGSVKGWSFKERNFR